MSRFKREAKVLACLNHAWRHRMDEGLLGAAEASITSARSLAANENGYEARSTWKQALELAEGSGNRASPGNGARETQ